MEGSGRRPILFIDEPVLSGYGSAFSTLQRDEVISLLKIVIDYLRENSEAFIGIHCCGNTDWSMIIDAGPDIVSFDAFAYLDYFLLYPEHISRHLENGGSLAWGIVPTVDAEKPGPVKVLVEKIEHGLRTLEQQGTPLALLADRSLLTPSCGMGGLETDKAKRTLEQLRDLSRLLPESLSF
jgi:methionine synthase II (cobalamin-independent)